MVGTPHGSIRRDSEAVIQTGFAPQHQGSSVHVIHVFPLLNTTRLETHNHLALRPVSQLNALGSLLIFYVHTGDCFELLQEQFHMSND